MLAIIKNKLHFIKAVTAVLYQRYPARRLKVIGVTGTDGKTTTATLIYHLLKKAGKKVALITTVAAYIGDKKIETGLHVTTPDPWVLQKLIRKIVNKGCEYLVLEITSHGLDQHRVLGTNVSVAVLTNITHEHLDYHKTYEKYFQAKVKLLRPAKTAVINREDISFKKLKRILNSENKLISYDRNTLSSPLKVVVRERFPEPYNQLNATAGILAVKLYGVKNSDIQQSIATFTAVEGRMQEVKNEKGFKIIIDFAHTPNALKNVLKVLKKQVKKNSKLISVFGCAGERDILKRSMMGEISARLADISVFTAEDPRGEDVNDIIAEMVKGANKTDAKRASLNNFDELIHRSKKHIYLKISERGEAIAFAIQKLARKGDTIVICGKGHEKSMSYNGTEYPWSDKKAVSEALNGREPKIIRNSYH